MLPGKAYTPEVVLGAAWRHKWLILLPFLTAAVATMLYSQALPDLYRSETLILVVPQRIPESFVRSTVTLRIEDRLRSIKEQLLSRTRLEQVIVEFGLFREERVRRPMEEIVELMRPLITLDTVRGDTFKIAYVARDPITPMKVASRLAEIFIEEDKRDRALMAEDTNAFLESQLADAKKRLVEHERKLENYRVQNAGQLPTQVASNLQVIQSAQGQIQNLAESINRDRDRRLFFERSLAELEGADGATPPERATNALPGAADSAGNRAVDDLEAARHELRALESRLKPEHPDVIAQKRRVQALEARASGVTPPGIPSGASPDEIRRGRIRQAQTELDKIDAQVEQKERETQRLQQVVDEYQKRVEAVPTRETELTELTRDYDTLQRLYTGLLGQKEASNISANLERRQVGEQFKVLDPARVAELPYSPNRVRINLTGAMAGLFLGLGFAGLREYRDTSLRTRDDVIAVLSLPVLAVIPVMESRRERRARRLRLTLTTAAFVGGLLVAGAVLAVKYGLVEWPL